MHDAVNQFSGRVGAVVEDLDFVFVQRIVHRRHSPDQTRNHIGFVVDGKLRCHRGPVRPIVGIQECVYDRLLLRALGTLPPREQHEQHRKVESVACGRECRNMNNMNEEVMSSSNTFAIRFG